jgi:serine phosphatase RsbU (regulator of sigma subunit)
MRDLIPQVVDQEVEGIAASIVDDVLRFTGTREQYDDMTLLVVKIR